MKHRLWRLYFWIYIISSLSGIFWLKSQNSFEIVFYLFSTSLYIMALYSFIYHKQFLPRWIWAVLFWLLIGLFFLQISYFLSYDSIIAELIKQGINDSLPKPNGWEFSLNAVFALPLYLALFNLGHPMAKNGKSRVNKSQLCWKIYFWILLIITILSIIGAFILPHFKISAYDVVSYIELILMQIALYGYVFRKSIFNKTIWRVIFWLTAVDGVLFTLYLFVPSLNSNEFLLSIFKKGFSSEFSQVEYLIFSALFIPALYALYKVGDTQRYNKLKKTSRQAD